MVSWLPVCILPPCSSQYWSFMAQINLTNTDVEWGLAADIQDGLLKEETGFWLALCADRPGMGLLCPHSSGAEWGGVGLGAGS